MSIAESKRREELLASIDIDAKALREVLVFATKRETWLLRGCKIGYDKCKACGEEILDVSHHRKNCPVRIAEGLRKVVP